MLISKLHNKESGMHYYSKEYLLDWIIDDKVVFVDQNNHMFKIQMNIVDFISTETYVYQETNSNEPYSSGRCGLCINNYEDYNLRFCDNQNDFNKNIIIWENGKTIFKIHPCNFCKYKDILNCAFVFDIGIAHKGSYDLAIEMVNTAHIKPNKINYCKNKNIGLIEVTSHDIMCLQNGVRYLHCNVLNHKEINGCIYYI